MAAICGLTMLNDICPIVAVGRLRLGAELPSLAESRPMLEATASIAWDWRSQETKGRQKVHLNLGSNCSSSDSSRAGESRGHSTRKSKIPAGAQIKVYFFFTLSWMESCVTTLCQVE